MNQPKELLEKGVAIIVRRGSVEERTMDRIAIEMKLFPKVRRTRFFQDGRWLMTVYWADYAPALDSWKEHPKMWWLNGEWYLLPDPTTYGAYAWRGD